MRSWLPIPCWSCEGTDEPTEAAETPVETGEDRDLVVRDNNDQSEDFDRLESFRHEHETEVWEGDDYRPARVSDGERDGKMDAMANAPHRAIPLRLPAGPVGVRGSD